MEKNIKTVESLTSAAGRSYGRIIGLFTKLGDIGYNSYCTLYETYVLPVANYAAGVWGFKDYSAPRVLQNSINRFYLGVHRFAPNAAASIEMNIANIRMARWTEMVRLHNRIMGFQETRIPRQVYEWEVNEGSRWWLREVSHICNGFHLPPPTA